MIRQVLRYVRPRMKNVKAALVCFRPVTPDNVVIADYRTEGIEPLQCLASTKRGLYFVGGGRITKLLDGYFYGVARDGDRWYVFQKCGLLGRIVQFRLEEGRMAESVQAASGLSPGCHQIDVIDGRLHVADTYNNRLLVFSTARRLKLARTYWPPGRLTNARESSNYAHMNSIWRCASGTYALFHNETTKTGRASEIVKLNGQFQIVDRTATTAADAHNIALYEGRFMYCDSRAGTLVLGDSPVFRCGHFTRGLSITDDFVIVGRSEYGVRAERGRLAGGLTVLDHDFSVLGEIELPGMVQEIRSASAQDHGMSGDGRHTGFRADRLRTAFAAPA